MVKKANRAGMSLFTNRYAKPNNKYMKDYDKNKELSHLKHWDVIICMTGQCCKSYQ